MTQFLPEATCYRSATKLKGNSPNFCPPKFKASVQNYQISETDSNWNTVPNTMAIDLA